MFTVIYSGGLFHRDRQLEVKDSLLTQGILWGNSGVDVLWVERGVIEISQGPSLCVDSKLCAHFLRTGTSIHQT